MRTIIHARAGGKAFRASLIAAFILTVTSAHASNLTWTKLSAGTYNWDTTSLNWTNSSGVVTNFTNGGVDNVLFPAQGGFVTVTVGPSMNPLSATVNSAATYLFTTGPIAGSGSLTLNGSAGSWVQLQNANTYSGGTFLNGGVLHIQDNSALGTGALTISGSTAKQLRPNGSTAINFANAVILSNAAITMNENTYPQLTSSGAWTILGSGTISNGSLRCQTLISGPIGGSGDLTLMGAANSGSGVDYTTTFFKIAGLNTYTGATILTSTVVNTRILITGTNLNTSGTTLYGAEVQVGSPLVFGTNAVTIAAGGGGRPTTVGVVGSGSTVTISNQFNVNVTEWAIAGGGYGTLAYAGPIILGTNVNLQAGQNSATISGNISGNFGINIGSHPSSGTSLFVTLSGVNSYTGATILGSSIPSGGFYDAGRLIVSGGNAIPDSSPVILTNISNTLLQINNNERIGSLQGGGTAGGQVTIASTTLFTGGNNSNTTFAGLINDSGSGGRVVKEGTGTFTLSGANSYTSGTIVSNGTLLVNNSSGSGTGSGTVRVAPTAKLGGTGTISGAVTVDAGATLAPGNSPGVLHMNGGLTLASNATFSVEINGPTLGTQYDQADVIGTVALTNSLLQLIMGFSPTPGQQFTIINNDASDAIGGTFAGLPQGSFIDASGLGNNAYFNISYTGGSGNDVVLTATIPEPATLTLLTISGLLVLRRRRR